MESARSQRGDVRVEELYVVVKAILRSSSGRKLEPKTEAFVVEESGLAFGHFGLHGRQVLLEWKGPRRTEENAKVQDVQQEPAQVAEGGAVVAKKADKVENGRWIPAGVRTKKGQREFWSNRMFHRCAKDKLGHFYFC